MNIKKLCTPKKKKKQGLLKIDKRILTRLQFYSLYLYVSLEIKFSFQIIRICQQNILILYSFALHTRTFCTYLIKLFFKKSNISMSTFISSYVNNCFIENSDVFVQNMLSIVSGVISRRLKCLFL